MRFQLTAIAVICAIICLFENAQTFGIGPVGPTSFCSIHSSILASQAAKVNTPDLPEDLKQRLNEVLENSAKGCTDCDSLLVWQSKVCVVGNLRSSLLQIQQIQAEADARLATTTAPVQ